MPAKPYSMGTKISNLMKLERRQLQAHDVTNNSYSFSLLANNQQRSLRLSFLQRIKKLESHIFYINPYSNPSKRFGCPQLAILPFTLGHKKRGNR